MSYLVNKIRTPDGTILESRHVHDFKSHLDANGNQYAVDGGLDYLRRIGPPDYEELSVPDDGKIETAREHLVWGTYGKKGKGPLKYVLLKDMSNAHIEEILRRHCGDIQTISERYANYLSEELIYRHKNFIFIED